MPVRPSRPADVLDSPLPWLVPDADVVDGTCLVEVVEGRVVAAGLRRAGRTGSPQDGAELSCEEGHGAELLRQLAAAADRPLLVRVLPGTPEETAVGAAGGRVVQSVPAAYVPTDHPDVREWAVAALEGAAGLGVEVVTADGSSTDELLDLWMAPFLRMHEGWSPVGDPTALRERFRARFDADLVRGCSALASTDEGVVAAVLTFGPYDGTLMPLLVHVRPGSPAREVAARTAVAATLAAAAPVPVEFDGHADDPVYMAVLEKIPQRRAGALTPMHLVEVP